MKPLRHELELLGEQMVLDQSGVLYWPDEKLLIVADLHFEKGSAFARRGAFIPPYDTLVTLTRLEALVHAYAPRTVLSLGDGFHDGRGPGTLSSGVFDQLNCLMCRVQWCWITGNHDPRIPIELGGAMLAEVQFKSLTFRHQPNGKTGEVTGHLHPKARVAGRTRRVSRPWFVADASRLLMPAFGWYAGGLNVLNQAVTCLFSKEFDAYLLGDKRIYCLPRTHLLADAY